MLGLKETIVGLCLYGERGYKSGCNFVKHFYVEK
jgi:hypothetical protein